MEIKNGKIYKITNLINNKMYIGLTTEPISVRWSGHKSYMKTDNNIYLYKDNIILFKFFSHRYGK